MDDDGGIRTNSDEFATMVSFRNEPQLKARNSEKNKVVHAATGKEPISPLNGKASKSRSKSKKTKTERRSSSVKEGEDDFAVQYPSSDTNEEGANRCIEKPKKVSRKNSSSKRRAREKGQESGESVLNEGRARNRSTRKRKEESEVRTMNQSLSNRSYSIELLELFLQQNATIAGALESRHNQGKAAERYLRDREAEQASDEYDSARQIINRNERLGGWWLEAPYTRNDSKELQPVRRRSLDFNDTPRSGRESLKSLDTIKITNHFKRRSSLDSMETTKVANHFMRPPEMPLPFAPMSFTLRPADTAESLTKIIELPSEELVPFDTVDTQSTGSVFSEITGLTGILSEMRSNESARKSDGVHASNENYSKERPLPVISIQGGPRLKKKKSVSFGTVSIRSYQRILGNNPSCTSGPSLTIGWQFMSHLSVPLDNWEITKTTHRKPTELVLSRAERERILLELGYSRRELAVAVRNVIKTKNQRRQTVQNLGASGVEEMMESARRRVKELLFIGNKYSEYS